MKKTLLTICLLLLFSISAQAEINVFLLPDSGFLRVEGQIIIEPTSNSATFSVFPGAQITEFWADELLEYQIERRAQTTYVHFTLKRPGRQSLSFSYEGFIDPQPHQATMGPDILWFPEFSFATHNPEIIVQLPAEWNLLTNATVETEKRGQNQFFKWQQVTSYYPVFTASYAEHSLPPLPEVIAEVIHELPSVEFLSRLQMQMNRLTMALNKRAKEEIQHLLAPNLQDTELAQYLASLPANFGQFKSEFLTEPAYIEDQFRIILTNEQREQFEVTLNWKEQQDSLKLETFKLIPYVADPPRELKQSLTNFVQRLEQASQEHELQELREFFIPDFEETHYVNLLANLKTTKPWNLEYIAMEPFGITIFVFHQDQTRLLLNLELTPGATDWLIRALRVVPLD